MSIFNIFVKRSYIAIQRTNIFIQRIFVFNQRMLTFIQRVFFYVQRMFIFIQRILRYRMCRTEIWSVNSAGLPLQDCTRPHCLMREKKCGKRTFSYFLSLYKF